MRIVEGGKRSDGRRPEDLRLINSRCGLLPRAHGSALFTRGETQMAQRLDNLVGEDEFKRFYLQINGKGQLQLSRRALLPDSNTENSGTKQRTVDLSEESTEKGKQNSVTRAVEVENAKLSNEISVDIEVRRSSKSKPVMANTLMEDKFVKKLVSSAKNALESDRNRPKKSSDKPAISISSKNEIVVVNGEAKS